MTSAFTFALLGTILSGVATLGAQDTLRAPAGDGVRLRYVVHGAGRDTVIVPLAAWMERSLEALSIDRTVVFYDPRGRGGSTSPADTQAYGWVRDVADLESLRKHLRLSRFALVGGAYYGALAALYASQHPGRVTRVVMVGPLRPVAATKYTHRLTARQRIDTLALAALASMRKAGAETNDPVTFCRVDLFARAMPSIMGHPDFGARLLDDPCAFPNEWPSRAATFSRYLSAANGQWDWRTQARRARTPVLILQGEDDPVSPVGAGREWARRLPDAKLLVIAGAGHAPWLDGVPLFFDAIAVFLGGTWPVGAESVRVAGPR